MRIVYHSYEGRYSDNPRALYETLVARGDAHEHVWLVDERHRAGFPEGVRLVPYGGPACVEALGSADLVVANTHTDLDWDKPEGTTYLQTWHGTPLKRIHHDVLWAPEGRLERLDRDIARWDRLVSPSPWATGALRQAFRYEGEVLETGYPRNDALLAPDREEVRARVRKQLGIPDGVRAVLYTPTWRDDEVFTGGVEDGTADRFALRLDVDAFDARFGGDHRLLLRLHYMQTGRLAAQRHASVVDVSFHPDIRDLYLAADVLVTDYSSTMFDFAITGKPMAFFAYDLARYRDEVRGFYLDLEEEAPGPVVDTSAALLDALADLDAVTAQHEAAYARFHGRYCSLEDGRAGERVLEHLVGAAA